MIYAGTSGWAYGSWKPDFYPAKLASAKFLNHYASRLNTVEVNYTFRRFPTEKLLRGWIAATPVNFKFAIKAHQKITHMARLRDVADFTSDFLRSLQPLDQEKKLGAVLFQLPPFLKCDVALLKDFWARCRGLYARRSSFGTSPGSARKCTVRCARRTRHCATRKAKSWRRRTCKQRILRTCGCGKKNTR